VERPVNVSQAASRFQRWVLSRVPAYIYEKYLQVPQILEGEGGDDSAGALGWEMEGRCLSVEKGEVTCGIASRLR
jgi:hypothetical protein